MPRKSYLLAVGERLAGSGLFRDVAAVTMDLNGSMQCNVDTLGGADTVTVGDLTGTDLSAANVDLSGTPAGGGDGQADSVESTAPPARTMSMSDLTPAPWSSPGSPHGPTLRAASRDRHLFDVDALAGDDRLTSGVGVTGPSAIVLDGGAGNDTATYSGTSAADTIGSRSTTGPRPRTFAPGNSPPQDTTGVENLVCAGSRRRRHDRRGQLARATDPPDDRRRARGRFV